MEEYCVVLDSKRKPIAKEAREHGDYPYYGANGVQDYVADYIFDGVYVLIGEDGSVITPDGHPVITWAEGKIWVNNHAHIIQGNALATTRFLYYYLQTVNVSEMIHGSIPKLNQGDFRSIEVRIPSLDKQKEVVRLLDRFNAYCNDISEGLPAEIEARQKQYEFYRDKLLSF